MLWYPGRRKFKPLASWTPEKIKLNGSPDGEPVKTVDFDYRKVISAGKNWFLYACIY